MIDRSRTTAGPQPTTYGIPPALSTTCRSLRFLPVSATCDFIPASHSLRKEPTIIDRARSFRLCRVAAFLPLPFPRRRILPTPVAIQ